MTYINVCLGRQKGGMGPRSKKCQAINVYSNVGILRDQMGDKQVSRNELATI